MRVVISDSQISRQTRRWFQNCKSNTNQIISSNSRSSTSSKIQTDYFHFSKRLLYPDAAREIFASTILHARFRKWILTHKLLIDCLHAYMTAKNTKRRNCPAPSGFSGSSVLDALLEISSFNMLPTRRIFLEKWKQIIGRHITAWSRRQHVHKQHKKQQSKQKWGNHTTTHK